MIWYEQVRTILGWIFKEHDVSTCNVQEAADPLDEVLRTLTPKEEMIVRMRTTMTLQQVGSHFSDTQETIRQIESKALKKLRHPSKSKHLKEFLDR